MRTMGGLISYLLSLVRAPSIPNFARHLTLPLPPVMHQVLEERFVQKFREIIVIGDVHGCFDEMAELLQTADVENDTVLKLFVGDLVNKGPKSSQVVEYAIAHRSTVLSVRGNHDEVVLREFRNSKNPDYTLSERNQWIKTLPQDHIAYLTDLPFTIRIPCLQVVVVHAGLIPGIPVERTCPHDLVSMRNLIVRDYFSEGGIQAIKDCKEGQPWASLWPGPDHVYFGHDAKRMKQDYPFATGLDTGCVYGKALTGVFIYGPRKGTVVSVDARKVYEKPGGSKNE